MLKNYLQITPRYLKNQGKRTLMTIIGIVLSTALIAGVGTLGLSMWHKMYEETVAREGAYEAEITFDSKENAEKIKNYVSISKTGTVAVLGTGGKNLIDSRKNILTEAKEFDPSGYKLRAYDENALEMWPISLSKGRLPKSSDEIIIGDETLPYLREKINIGDKISFDISSNEDNGKVIKSKKYTIVGFLDSNLNFSRRMEGITYYDSNSDVNNANYIAYVNFKDDSNVHKAVKKLLNDLGGTNQNTFKVSYNEQVLRFLLQSNNNGYNTALISGIVFLGIIVVLAMSAVIYNIFNIAILERISQYGLIRCLGATKEQIRKLVVKEAFILSAIGIPIGIITGTFAIKMVMSLLNIIVPDLPYGNLKLIISPYIIIISAVLSLISIYISAFGPARRTSKISPLDAIRNTGSLKKEKFKNLSSGKLMKKFFGAEGWIARKNLGRNRKRFVITVFSMVISIVLLIVFDSVIDLTYKTGANDSNNEFFQFQISHKDNRGDVKLSDEDYKTLSSFKEVDIIYKYYYRYFDSKQNDSIGDEVIVSDDLINPKLKDFNKKWYDSRQVYGRYVDFNRSQIVGLSNENLSVLKKYLIQGEINPDKMNDGKGVVIVNTGESYNVQTNQHAIMDKLNVKVGDKIRLKISKNNDINKGNLMDEYKEYTVYGILKQGIWGQKFNLDGGINVFATEETYRELTSKDRNPDYLVIKLKDNANSAPVRNYLNTMIKNYPNFLFRDRVQEMKENKEYNIALSILIYGFVIVIAAISSVNIFNTISTNIILRTRELSILKAVGMAKQEVNKLIKLECIFYSAAAIVIGDTLGAIGSAMLYKMFYSAVRIEWTIPWGAIIIATVGTIGITMLASYFPLKRINKTVIVEGINNIE